MAKPGKTAILWSAAIVGVFALVSAVYFTVPALMVRYYKHKALYTSDEETGRHAMKRLAGLGQRGIAALREVLRFRRDSFKSQFPTGKTITVIRKGIISG